MDAAVRDKVIEIIADQAMLEPAEIGLDEPLAEMGLDSIGLVEAIFAIEESFDIQVPFNANEPGAAQFDLSTPRAVIAAVEKLIAEQKAG